MYRTHYTGTTCTMNSTVSACTGMHRQPSQEPWSLGPVEFWLSHWPVWLCVIVLVRAHLLRVRMMSLSFCQLGRRNPTTPRHHAHAPVSVGCHRTLLHYKFIMHCYMLAGGSTVIITPLPVTG